MRLLDPTSDAGADELSDAALTRLYAAGDRSRPALRVNFVSSADGAVTLDGASSGLSGPADKRVFRVLRAECDALLVGAGTVRREQYGPVTLNADRRAQRAARGLAEVPRLVVVSGRLDLDPRTRALADAPVRPTVLTHEGADPGRRAALEPVADVLAVGGTGAGLDLAAGLRALAERGLQQVLCEGGPQLFGSLVTGDLVDELCLTVSPLLAGAGAGRIVAGPTSPPRDLTLRHVLTGDGNLMLRYVRRRPEVQP